MSWTDHNVRQNLWRFRSYVFLKNLDFTRGIFVVFLLAQGLSNTQVGVLQAILFWTIFAFEIPTGIFADRTRRKVSTMLGTLLLVVTFGLFPFASGYPAYVALFVLWGLALSLCSGATSALLYDGLKGAGARWLKTHMAELGRLRAMATLCTAMSMAVAGFVYDLDQGAVFMVTAACAIASALMLAGVDEAPRKGGAQAHGWTDIAASLYLFARSAPGRNFMLLMIALSLLEASHTPLFIMSQSLLREMGLSPSQLTALLGANFLVCAVGMYFAPKFNITNLRVPVLGTMGVVAALALIVAMSSNLVVIVVALMLLNLVPNLLFVYTDHYFQENADSGIRASWGSLQSFVTASAVGSAFVALGLAGDAMGMRRAFLIFVPLLALGALLAAAHRWTTITHEAAQAPEAA